METASKRSIQEYFTRYAPLPEKVKALIVNYFEERFLAKGEFLLKEGEICRKENFVVSGLLRTFLVDTSGKEHTIQFSVANWWTGDLRSFLDEVPTSYFVETMEDSQVLQISRGDWDRLNQHPSVESALKLAFQRAHIGLHQRLVSLISSPAEERYLGFLSQFPEVAQRIPQKYIASYLGITPEYLSQIRRSLAEG